MVILTLLTVVYLVCVVTLSLYAIATLVLIVLYLLRRRRITPTAPLTEFPKVVVQLPIYNERMVVARLIDAAAALDYPADRLTIQVLDDSTDDTTWIAAAKAAEWSARGVNIQHIRRGSRDGFKAGALAHGLSITDAEYAAVFDADFVMPPDFLRQMLAVLVDQPTIACVQARWGHLNPFDNPLTQMQTLALDGHFVVEQIARAESGLMMNFNGSGGLWRISAIADAGGWRDTTLTEDLDLSYRAQLRGWRFAYRPDVVVPAELPATLTAYRHQQARWARGGTQVLRYLLVPVWRSQRSLGIKLMATAHLCQYIVHPMMIALVILTPILTLTHVLQDVSVGALGLLSLVPPLLFVLSQAALYPDWKRRILALPVLLVMGMGLSRGNTRAVLNGLFGGRGTFNRTPKTAGSRAQIDAPHFSLDWLWETAFAAYSIGAMGVAIFLLPSLAPYMALYGIAFSVFALVSVRESWLAYRASSRDYGMIGSLKRLLK